MNRCSYILTFKILKELSRVNHFSKLQNGEPMYQVSIINLFFNSISIKSRLYSLLFSSLYLFSKIIIYILEKVSITL
jgi:hypothetical protein